MWRHAPRRSACSRRCGGRRDPVPTDTPKTLVVELRLDDGRDRGSVDGVRITYTVNGRHYQAVFNAGAGPGTCENDENTDEESV